MEEINEKKIMWLVNSKKNKIYENMVWFRCVGIQEFIKKVENDNKIVAVIASGNNICFLLDDK